VRAKLFHTDRHTDKHDESNSCFSQFCESAYKIKVTVIQNNIISKMLTAALQIVSRTNAECTSESVGLCIAFLFCERDLFIVAA
jgi:hypothetical protein